MTRRETIIELARTLNDALAPDHGQPGIRTTSHEHRGHHLSTIYHAGSYHDLEHALRQMRTDGKHHPNLAKRQHAGIPLGVLRWHFTWRYIHATRTQATCRQHGNTYQILQHGTWQHPTNWQPLGHAQTDPHTKTRTIQIEQWRPDIKPSHVEHALDYLEASLPTNLRLPNWEQLSAAA